VHLLFEIRPYRGWLMLLGQGERGCIAIENFKQEKAVNRPEIHFSGTFPKYLIFC
jgi:hypothetical protein